MDAENDRVVLPTVPDLEHEAKKRPDDLLALSRVSAAVSGLWDLDAILGVALDTVLDIMNGSIGGILLLDEQTQTLCYRVHRGLSPRYAEEMCLSRGEGIAGRVAQNGKSVLVEDISTACAICAEPTKVLAINGNELESLFDKEHYLGYNVMKGLVRVIGTRLREIERLTAVRKFTLP